MEQLTTRPPVAAAIAAHFLAAAADGSDPLPGVEWARRAAQRALDNGEFADALTLLAGAAESIGAGGPSIPSTELHCDLLVELAAAQQYAGANDEHADTLERA